jgi:uncharacterized protein (UPF0147 family)
MKEEELSDVLEVLSDLSADYSVPRNVKGKIEQIIDSLKAKADISLKINKALDILEEISDDNNIDSYTRTRLFNVASMLEAFN